MVKAYNFVNFEGEARTRPENVRLSWVCVHNVAT